MQRRFDRLDRRLGVRPAVGGRHPAWDTHNAILSSGQSFTAKGLKKEGSFKAAEARYTTVDDVDAQALARWLAP